MIFSVIQSRTADYLDRDDLTTKIQGWINDTRKDIAIKYNFGYIYVEATAVTSAGSARYALPCDYLDHLDVFSNSKKLARVESREFDELTQTCSTYPDILEELFTESGVLNDLTRGTPDYYVVRGMEIQLYPTPDDIYTLTLKYYALPSDFSSDGDYDYISTFHPEAVIFGAALRGAIFLDDEQKKTTYAAAYDAAIKEMVRREKDRERRDVKIRMKTYKDYSLDTFKRIMKVNT